MYQAFVNQAWYPIEVIERGAMCAGESQAPLGLARRRWKVRVLGLRPKRAVTYGGRGEVIDLRAGRIRYCE